MNVIQKIIAKKEWMTENQRITAMMTKKCRNENFEIAKFIEHIFL